MSAGVSSACLKIEDDISKISEFISNPLLCKNTSSKKDTKKSYNTFLSLKKRSPFPEISKKDPNKIKGCYPWIQPKPEVWTPSFHGSDSPRNRPRPGPAPTLATPEDLQGAPAPLSAAALPRVSGTRKPWWFCGLFVWYSNLTYDLIYGCFQK